MAIYTFSKKYEINKRIREYQKFGLMTFSLKL